MKRIVAVNSNCYHKYSVEDAIRGISDAGFRYIELTATKGWTEHVFPTMTFEYLCKVKDLLRASGLAPFAMSGHTNLMDTSRLEDFVSNIKLAAFFGCDYIVSSIGEAHIEDKASASDKDAAENIRGLLPSLEEHKLTLVLETHGEHGTGERLANLVGMVGSERVAVNYDTANVMYFAGFDEAGVEKDLSACMDKLGFMHIKDKAGAVNEWNFPALGQGYVNFPAIFKKLDDAGNNCPLSIEIEFGPEGSRDIGEVNEAVRASYSYLKSIGMEP